MKDSPFKHMAEAPDAPYEVAYFRRSWPGHADHADMATKFYVSCYTSPITIPLVTLASIGSLYIHVDVKANISYAWIRGVSGWEDFTSQYHLLKPSHHPLYPDRILKRRTAFSIEPSWAKDPKKRTKDGAST